MSAASNDNIEQIQYASQQDAVHELNEACSALVLCYDLRVRLNHVLGDVGTIIDALNNRKHAAQAAITLFAETCPPCGPMQSEIESVSDHVALLIADAEEVIRKARGQQS